MCSVCDVECIHLLANVRSETISPFAVVMEIRFRAKHKSADSLHLKRGTESNLYAITARNHKTFTDSNANLAVHVLRILKIKNHALLSLSTDTTESTL